MTRDFSPESSMGALSATEPERGRKQWRRPSLQKLPVAATAGSKSRGGGQSGTKSSGDAAPQPTS